MATNTLQLRRLQFFESAPHPGKAFAIAKACSSAFLDIQQKFIDQKKGIPKEEWQALIIPVREEFKQAIHDGLFDSLKFWAKEGKESLEGKNRFDSAIHNVDALLLKHATTLRTSPEEIKMLIAKAFEDQRREHDLELIKKFKNETGLEVTLEIVELVRSNEPLIDHVMSLLKPVNKELLMSGLQEIFEEAKQTCPDQEFKDFDDFPERFFLRLKEIQFEVVLRCIIMFFEFWYSEKPIKKLLQLFVDFSKVHPQTAGAMAQLNQLVRISMPDEPDPWKKIYLALQDFLDRLEKAGRYNSVPNSTLYFLVRQALAVGKNEFVSTDVWPKAMLISKTVKGFLQLKPETEKDITELPVAEFEELQQRMADYINNLDDETADVLDIVSFHWLLSNPKDFHQMVKLDVDQFLKYRGLRAQKSGSGRRGGYKKEWRQRIARHLEILSNVWVVISEMEILEVAQGKKGPYTRKKKWTGESKTIVVSSRAGQVTLDGHIEPSIWLLRPGDVFAKHLLGPGRQIAMISAKALYYDPFRRAFEKRLVRYLAWQWRIRKISGRNFSGPFSVKTILQSIRLVMPGSPQRTLERFEKALDLLQHDGIVGEWRYQETREYEKVQGLILQGKHSWCEAWNRLNVLIEPPPELQDYYGGNAMPQNRIREITSSASNMIRFERRKRRISQLIVAEETGLPVSVIEQIEKGKRSSKKEDRKIKKWVAPGSNDAS